MHPEFAQPSESSGEVKSSPFPGRQKAWQNRLKHYSQLVHYGLLGTAGVLLLVGVPIGVQHFGSREAEVPEAPASRVLPVETQRVQTVASYEVSRTYTGEIAALRSSDLGFERGGELVQLLVKEGDRVKAGQPLAQLDIRNLQTQRLQLQAQKAQAIAKLAELEAGPRPEAISAAQAAVRELERELALRKIQRSRREYLYTEGAISREQRDEFAYGAETLTARLDQSRSNLEELLNGTRKEQIAAQQAVVKQLEASLADLDVTLSKSTITAPFAGIIAKHQVDEGTVVGVGQSVIRLMENAAPEARIGLPAEVVNQLQLGSRQQVQIGEKTYAARVSAILPEVDANTRTQVAVLIVEGIGASATNPGQTVRLALTQTLQTKGYWLPISALTKGLRGLWTCYAVTQPANSTQSKNTFAVEQRTVEILHQESDKVLVRGTLQSGDRVVVNGTHRLVPGQQVRPIAALEFKNGRGS